MGLRGMENASKAAIDARLMAILRAISNAGGRAVIVGGWVRDQLLGIASKDIDVEVYGLQLEQLEAVLRRFGKVQEVGRSFGVLLVHGLGIDFALPRRDSKRGTGHRGFDVAVDPSLSFEQAACRRDVTVNSMGFDPLTDELLDPYGGQADLESRILRATDVERFSEDALRGVRVAQFAARFDMQPDAELLGLCKQLDLAELSPERLYQELCKLLLKGVRPSVGLKFLQDTELLRFFPELQALVGVEQDPKWHPEGDVWVHTLAAVDQAARLRLGDGDEDLALMFGVLCHDFGKAVTTVKGPDARIRSPGHDVAGVELAFQFMQRLRAPHKLTERVCALTRHHLAPALFIKNGATAKGYRRLARKLQAADVHMELLVRLARADHLGRDTDDARAGTFTAGDRFLSQAAELLLERGGPQDVVMGRHLVTRGLEPGPDFGAILDLCRDIQDETGWQDPERILKKALRQRRKSLGS